jgi:hypothetical protein
MTGCSESQVTSYLDFSTNYCDLHDLYCGSKDGCKFVTSDLKYEEEIQECDYHDKGQCKPSAPVTPGRFLANADLGCSDCQARQKQGENIACPMCTEEQADLGCSDCHARQKQGENIACPMCVMRI